MSLPTTRRHYPARGERTAYESPRHPPLWPRSDPFRRRWRTRPGRRRRSAGSSVGPYRPRTPSSDRRV